MSYAIHMPSPLLTIAQFSKVSGLSVRAVNYRIDKGELPVIRIGLDKDRKSTPFINMIKLFELAAGDEFTHPKAVRSSDIWES